MMSKLAKMPPKMVIGVIYKSKDKTWRGFCVPFDISCTANTAKETISKLDELVEIYMDGLHKYGYPPHLTVKEISDEEDKKVFEKVLDHIVKDVANKMKKDFEKFQLERETSSFRIGGNIKVRGSYSFLPTNTPALVS